MDKIFNSKEAFSLKWQVLFIKPGRKYFYGKSFILEHHFELRNSQIFGISKTTKVSFEISDWHKPRVWISQENGSDAINTQNNKNQIIWFFKDFRICPWPDIATFYSLAFQPMINPIKKDWVIHSPCFWCFPLCFQNAFLSNLGTLLVSNIKALCKCFKLRRKHTIQFNVCGSSKNLSSKKMQFQYFSLRCLGKN